MLLAACLIFLAVSCVPSHRVVMSEYTQRPPSCGPSEYPARGETSLLFRTYAGELLYQISPAIETIVAHKLCGDSNLARQLDNGSLRVIITGINPEFGRKWAGFDIMLGYSGYMLVNGNARPFNVSTMQRVPGNLEAKKLGPVIEESTEQFAAEIARLISGTP